MKQIILALVMLPLFLRAQIKESQLQNHSTFTYFFKISDEAAEEAFTKKGSNSIMPCLTELVDSVMTDSLNFDHFKQTLGYGNYAMLSAENAEMQVSLFCHAPFNVYISQDEEHLQIQLKDLNDSIISNAQVKGDARKMRFDEKLEVYERNNPQRVEYISIDYNGKTYWYDVNMLRGWFDKKGITKQKIAARPWLKGITAPLIVFRIPFDALRSLVRFYPYGTIEHCSNGISWSAKSIKMLFCTKCCDTRRQYSVYGFTNKPLYRKGDTVFYKAMIFDKKGRPLKRDVIAGLGNGKKQVDTLYPYREGMYTGFFVVDENMRLDSYQTIYFRTEHEVFSRSISFRTEDYELQDNIYDVSIVEKLYPSDSLSFTLSAHDQNGNAVMDGRYEASIIFSSIDKQWEFAVTIHDTIWSGKGLLSPKGETVVRIPHSIFPKADLQCRLSVNFLNSNNEFVFKQKYFSYTHFEAELHMKAVDDSLLFSAMVNGKEKKGMPLSIEEKTSDNSIRKTYKGTSPFKIPISESATEYDVASDSLHYNFDLYHTWDGIYASFRNTRDSVFCTISNPHAIQYNYSLYEGDILKEKGIDKSQFAMKLRKRRTYTLFLNYVWAGKAQNKKFVFEPDSKPIQIDITYPESVVPNEKVDFTIKVTDHKGKPVANADIASFALNSKLDKPQIALPTVGQENLKKVYKGEFKIEKSRKHISKTVSNETYKRYGLDSILYYSLLFENRADTTVLIFPAEDSVTQFAPFIVNNGYIEPIVFISVDFIPRYYSFAFTNGRYSIPVKSGYSNVILRTTTHEYNMSLDCKEGCKTILFVGDSVKYNDTYNVHQREITDYDKKEFAQHIFKQGSRLGSASYIKAGDQIFRPTYNTLLGPVHSYRLEVVSDIGTKKLPFEKNSTYYLHDDYVKIKQQEKPFHFSFNANPQSFNIRQLNQMAFSEQKAKEYIQEVIEENKKKHYCDNIFSTFNLTDVSIGVDNPALHDSIKRFLFVNAHDTVNVYLDVDRYAQYDKVQLPIGEYEYYYEMNNGALYKGQGIVKADFTKTYYILNLTRGKELTDENKDALLAKPRHYYIPEKGNRWWSNNSVKIIGQIVDKKTNKPIEGVKVFLKRFCVKELTNKEGKFEMFVPSTGGELLIYKDGYGHIMKVLDETSITVTLEEIYIISEKTLSIIEEEEKRNKNGDFWRRGIPFGEVKPEDLLMIDGIHVSSEEASVALFAASESNSSVGFTSPKSARRKDKRFHADGVFGDSSGDSWFDPNACYDMSPIPMNAASIVKTEYDSVVLFKNVDFSQPHIFFRSNFKDYAFWEPQLTTNNEGIATFSATLPGNITSWNGFAIAYGGKKRFAQKQFSFKTELPYSTEIKMPRFAMEGDSLGIITKALNFVGDSSKMIAKTIINGDTVARKTFMLTNAEVQTHFAIASGDSMRVEYHISKENYTDASRNVIAVMKQGMEKDTGVFHALYADTTFSIQVPRKDMPVHVYATMYEFKYLERSIKALKDYKHSCNEQLASKLMAFCSDQYLFEYQHTEKEYPHKAEIEKILNTLKENSGSGLWSWWGKGDKTEYWVSYHVIRALLMAEKLGYDVDLEKTKEQLVSKLTNKDNITIELLQILKECMPSVPITEALDYLDDTLPHSTRNFLRMQMLRQANGETYDFDSVMNLAQYNVFGAAHFEPYRNQTYIFERYDYFKLHLDLYTFIRNHNASHPVLPKMRQYVFAEMGTNFSRFNTITQANILRTFLPDMNISKEDRSAYLSINGKQYSNFPVKIDLTDTVLSITKGGKGYVYFTAYQTIWDTNPKSYDEYFSVQTQLPTDTLEAGKPITMKVSVEMKKGVDYAMLQVPIPAGCSYNAKNQSSYYAQHTEYFRNETVFYFSNLLQGTYSFEIKLLPKYSGRYIMNPSKLEHMYFPTFYGNNEIKKVTIRQQKE